MLPYAATSRNDILAQARRILELQRMIILLSGPPRHRGRTRVEQRAKEKTEEEKKKKKKNAARRRLEEERARRSRRGQGEEEVRPLRPLSSFEVHERLRRTKRRRAGYSLPFLLSRGVLPFPVEARNGEPLHGPFTITIINGDRQKERRADARDRARGGKEAYPTVLPPSPALPLPSLLEGNASNAGKRRGTARF